MPVAPEFVAPADDVAFVASDEGSLPGTDQVAALDGATGSVVWQQFTWPKEITGIPPLIVGDELLVGTTIPGSPPQDGILALRTTDGQQLWSAPAALLLIPSPDGTVLYDVPNGSTIEARGMGDGRLLWVDTHAQLAGRILVGTDAVYVLPQYGSVSAYSIAALARQTNTPLWQFGDRDFVHAGAILFVHAGAILGDTLYVSANISDTGGDHPETVYALDAHTGAVRWSFATQSLDSGSLAVCHGTIFIQAADGVHALRSTGGHVLWRESAHPYWTPAPWSTWCIGSTAYFTDAQFLPPETVDGSPFNQDQTYLYAVNADNGSLYLVVPIGPVNYVYPRWLSEDHPAVPARSPPA
jgi:outer membrane protein assembly factor BamB